MDELAPTLEYDFAVVGNTTKGGTMPFDLLAKVTQPTLAVCGTASPEFMIDAARVVDEQAQPLGPDPLARKHLDLRLSGGEALLDVVLEGACLHLSDVVP